MFCIVCFPLLLYLFFNKMSTSFLNFQNSASFEFFPPISFEGFAKLEAKILACMSLVMHEIHFNNIRCITIRPAQNN